MHGVAFQEEALFRILTHMINIFENKDGDMQKIVRQNSRKSIIFDILVIIMVASLLYLIN